jgi:hypothetical protein
LVEEKIKPQDFEHPKPENLSYDKYIHNDKKGKNYPEQ